MSNKALNWAYAQSTNGDPLAKFLLITLANRLNANNGKLNPSIPTLAADMGCSHRTVKDKIEVLREAGLITTKRKRYGLDFELEMCTPRTSGDDPDVQTTPSRSANERTSDVQTSVARIKNRNLTRKKQPPAARESARPRPRSGIQKDFKPELSIATVEGLTEPEAEREAKKFLAHHRGKGTLAADWPAMWASWCADIPKYRTSRSPYEDETDAINPFTQQILNAPDHEKEAYVTNLRAAGKHKEADDFEAKYWPDKAHGAAP